MIAAAIHARADMIVTKSLKDHPADILARHYLEAQHPDDFILNQMDLDEPAVISAARICRARRVRPPHSVTEFLDGLERNQPPKSVSRLRGFAGFL